MSDKRELLELKKQFFLAVGYESLSFDFSKISDEFFEWYKERFKALGDYIMFLESFDCDFEDSHTAEIGKSGYDSIVIPFETRIITPYVSNLTAPYKSIDEKRIIRGRMSVVQEEPVVFSSNFNSANFLIEPEYIDTFMTQNIYNECDINNWEDLHNSGVYDIIVGAYGHTYDKDIGSKISRIKKLRDGFLDDYYREYYTTLSDKYFYVLCSDCGCPKTKILSRNR